MASDRQLVANDDDQPDALLGSGTVDGRTSESSQLSDPDPPTDTTAPLTRVNSRTIQSSGSTSDRCSAVWRREWIPIVGLIMHLFYNKETKVKEMIKSLESLCIVSTLLLSSVIAMPAYLETESYRALVEQAKEGHRWTTGDSQGSCLKLGYFESISILTQIGVSCLLGATIGMILLIVFYSSITHEDNNSAVKNPTRTWWKHNRLSILIGAAELAVGLVCAIMTFDRYNTITNGYFGHMSGMEPDPTCAQEPPAPLHVSYRTRMLFLPTVFHLFITSCSVMPYKYAVKLGRRPTRRLVVLNWVVHFILTVALYIIGTLLTPKAELHMFHVFYGG
jgi:hypothetical protein